MQLDIRNYRFIQPEPLYYSKEDLVLLLRSTRITDEFREQIIRALDAGTEQAIRSLGERFTA